MLTKVALNTRYGLPRTSAHSRARIASSAVFYLIGQDLLTSQSVYTSCQGVLSPSASPYD